MRQSQQQEQAQATAAAERLAASRLQAETTADAAGRASHLPHANGRYGSLATDLTRTALRRRGQSDCPGDAHLRRRQRPRRLRSLHQVNATL